MLPLCLQLNELTLLLAIFFAFAALPACSRQVKPEIKAEQLTPEQQARAKRKKPDLASVIQTTKLTEQLMGI